MDSKISLLSRLRELGKGRIKYFFYSYVFLYPAILASVLELISTGGKFRTAAGQPLWVTLSAFALTYLLIGLIMAVLSAITGRPFISALIMSVALGAVHVANHFRFQMSGWILTPGDLLLTSSIGKIVDLSKLAIEPLLILVVVLVFALLALFFAATRGALAKLSAKARLITLFAAAAAFLCLFCTKQLTPLIFQGIGVDRTSYKLSINKIYYDYGVPLGFYILLQEKVITSYNAKDTPGGHEINEYEPLAVVEDEQFKESYGEERMLEIAEKIKGSVSSPVVSGIKPNIVVIMSEAFSDPYTWENISFSEDSAPNLHELMKNYTSGSIISPAFGGGTCNPEYEFLTGNSMYFTGSGQIPYEMYEKYIPEDDTRSFVSILKRIGYYTVGIHPYLGDFFNRNDVYPRVGFDDFISIEDMEGAEEAKKGRFTSDDYFTDQIISAFDASDDPIFIYGISMENHYEYFTHKIPGNENISGRSPNLDEAMTGAADSYFRGIYDADAALGKLIAHLSASSEPTLVFFFGDHKPLIGEKAYDFYASLGMISSTRDYEWTTDETYFMHTTPYVMWSNYGLAASEWGDMQPQFIGPMLLDAAGLPKNTYFQYLSDIYKNGFHAMIRGLYSNEDDSLSQFPIMQDKDYLFDLYYLQYDYTEGKRYAADIMSEMIGD